MGTAQSIESRGLEFLKNWLVERGRKVEESTDKTFDLIVDGEYAELKAKGNKWDKFDFLSLTENQEAALGGKLKKIFLVLNVNDIKEAKVIEIDAAELRDCKRKTIVHYEWNKGVIAHLCEK